MLFQTKNLVYYVAAISIVTVAAYIGNKFKTPFAENQDEYALIKEYLLNDSPLYGYKKPKIWIHTKFEYNARVWKSFQSRSSYDLNQPYLHLTIKSIIDHCGDDYHICLIDDNTFSKLIPSWDIDLHNVSEPMKHYIRQIGLAELVYYYGGMVVPNSFLCKAPLDNFFLYATADDKPFVCEAINRNVNLLKQDSRRLAFLPSTYFMGANKNNETVKKMIRYMKEKIQTPHFSSERDFLGDIEYWCLDAIDRGEMNLVGGELIGVKTINRKPILLDYLMEEEFLALSEKCVGIYIPADEILERTRFQWFAVMPVEDVLKTDCIISKYMKAAVLSGNRAHIPSKIRTAISI